MEPRRALMPFVDSTLKSAARGGRVRAALVLVLVEKQE
jgi:hypothetical protein